jgi:O-antigen/teichoic acid export membrane protein
MSLKKNIISNYISQIYGTLIGIVMVPLYIRYMGTEAYGLVGFFAMLQAWFQLLDMGLAPTMARETARFQGGATDALSLRRLLRVLEGIFFGVAIVGATAMIAGAGVLAGRWLKIQQLSIVEVQHAIMLMALIAALRLVCGLYRGAVNGFERIVWLSGFNTAISTVRFVLVIPVFIYIGTEPVVFFGFQLAVAIIETGVLVIQTYRLMPRIEIKLRPPWQWMQLRGVIKFSLSIAFSGSLWILVTQTDKLVLSKLLTLTDYAYFTLAVLVASGVSIISGPISGAIVPRLTRLNAEGDEAGLIRLYRNATQLVGVIAIPAALFLAFFAEQVLLTWTGDSLIARTAAPVLRLYALGNGILAMGAFPYYLQYAKGDLRLHVVGSVLFVVLLIPCLFLATWRFGMIGPGYAWLGTNSVLFLFWLPKVHAYLVRGLHLKWLLKDLGPIFVVSIVSLLAVHTWVIWPVERIPAAMRIAEVCCLLLVFAATGSSWVRDMVRCKLNMRFAGKG